MSEIHIIEADHYREEQAKLMADPIILAMNDEIPAGTYLGTEFMLTALHEYTKRGGTQATSIGGPARAIKALRELA